MGSIGYALAAGNAVIFKPSEFTPKVAHYFSQLLTDVSPVHNLLQVLPHAPEFGAMLASSSVDKISFTGSTATGKKVAAACAANLTPHVLECGGKDAVIIDKDADIALCAENVLWASMSNAGQTCIGSERVYVHNYVAEEFISEISKRARELRAAPDGNYGRMTMPNLINVITERVSTAISDVAEFVVGGIDSISGNGSEGGFIQPIIMKNLPEDSAAMKEEIFGPTLIINRVSSMEEAIEKANSNPYGLGASVWSKSRGKKIASQLQSGMVSINSVLAFASIASLPFGGVKFSGYGRIHGEEGLKEFTYPHAVVSERFALPVKFTSFKRTAFADKFVLKITKFLNR
jgi:aldehyde dehydrogenase (NAD+)